MAPKKSAAGVGQRLAALRPQVAELDELLCTAPQACAIDDVLDALAAAWSARRLALGLAERLGDEATDVDGYRQTIVV
jgi:predicted RNase H-like nuclease